MDCKIGTEHEVTNHIQITAQCTAFTFAQMLKKNQPLLSDLGMGQTVGQMAFESLVAVSLGGHSKFKIM